MRARDPQFQIRGYSVIPGILPTDDIESLISALPEINRSGSRRLLAQKEISTLSCQLKEKPSLKRLLSPLVAIQCTYFRKTREHNWKVPPHRDTVVPAKGNGPWESAGVKDGMQTVKAPREFLDRCVAVRVHLDGAPIEDISVVPGSHLDRQQYSLNQTEPIAVPRGGALVMRPVLVHCSSKLEEWSSRRVLHFLYAPDELPEEYEWYESVWPSKKR